MGFRLKGDASHLYEVFIHLKRSPDNSVGSVVRFYPDGFVNEELFASVSLFAFPHISTPTLPPHISQTTTTYSPSTPTTTHQLSTNSNNHLSQPLSSNFTFVLTNMESKFRFGFCYLFRQKSGVFDGDGGGNNDEDDGNHGGGNGGDENLKAEKDIEGEEEEVCYCFISYFPYFSLFHNALDILHHTLIPTASLHHPLTFLSKLHEVTHLTQSQLIHIRVDEKDYYFNSPSHDNLQETPDDINLSILHSSLSTSNIIAIFASILMERRVLFHSCNLERLGGCVYALTLLIYPMIWQHLFIPILAPNLIDYCSAPMPYIIGVHESVWKNLRSSDYGDAVVVDVDNKQVISSHHDLTNLPRDVVSSLKKKLKKSSSNKCHLTTRAFFSAVVRLIGGYRNSLRFRMGESITFDAESFVAGGGDVGSSSSLSAQYKLFFRSAIHLQCFRQFIQERLDLLNSGGGFQDEFEIECGLVGEDRWKTQSRYKEWVTHMKVVVV